MKKYHYVYKITNIIENKYYIGSRSCSISPYLDLGHKYFSSSSVKKFIKDQLENRKNYEYEVLSTHDTRDLANDEEYRLLTLYQVDTNSMYINKQSSRGYNSVGRCTVKDSDGNTFSVKTNDKRIQTGELTHMHAGRVLTDDHKKKISEGVKIRFSLSPMKKTYTHKWYEWKLKLKETRCGKNNSFYGKHHSSETKKMISDKIKGSKHTNEAKKKISEFNKGKIISEKQKAIVGLKNRNKYIIDDIYYDGRAAASEATGISIPTLRGRCNSDKWPTWILVNDDDT